MQKFNYRKQTSYKNLNNYNHAIKRGNIYYANLSGSIGCEERGIRPVLVIQNDVGNDYSPTTIIAPITTKFRKYALPIHVPIMVENLKYSLVMLEQVRVLDKSRLLGYIGRLRVKEMKKIDRALRKSLYLE